MSYRLIDSNAIAMSHPEVNDMPCIYADLPNGLDGGCYDMADCEEIVRCRDCAKWSYFDDEDGVRFGDCAEFSKHEGEMHATRECGFCYWGERKEGGDD